jgi:mannose/fructose-specific phosphotransferase system component IIA
MSEGLTGVVLAHADLANALVAAVEAIVGPAHGLIPVSNIGCDRAAIVGKLEQALGSRPAVVFADMPGGSCAFGAAAFARGRPDVRVVTGVNLAMLLDFVFHRQLGAEQAAERAMTTGRAAVTGVEAGR